ncbi:MAG TPA: addiction module antidote protein, HigA family [Oceanicaulis sp.]|uniref:Transcriptional regulator n=1 Tax=Glycocaulis albus TaxID=1382801 RepID=A0ABQ1XDW9_9PROT|nr:HigA family addiction module antitoxin [Glycocaulis albus]GGG90154.1 transcriptional regulator [Glycocaulis albus]HCY55027.1 addiction module antidote protein, HigA family [Oceanicaulis sp.]
MDGANIPLLGLGIHPGEVLKEDFMVPLSLSASALAARLRTTPASISRIVNAKQAISAEMACRLARALGTTPAFWLSLQSQYDIAVLGDRVSQIEREVEPLNG